jgi:metallo-beta-lactamase family protein
MQIQFWGAAQHVTGSKHLLTTPKGTKILMDCGLFQGRMADRESLNRNFGFNPYDVDYVILSHAHIDHSGLLPRLVREGFKGIIFATPASISLCELMLLDSAHIQHDDLKFLNQRRKRKGLSEFEPLYDINDVERVLDMMTPVEYGEQLQIDREVTLMFTDAGHLIGSAAVHLDIKTPEKKLHLTFTGDIGRRDDPILRNPEPFRQCDVLICESTYGDRLHPQLEDSDRRLFQLVKETCVDNKGKLIIPAFSVDRTQEIVYSLEKMSNAGRLPDIKIYVDSPLSVRATDVIRKHEECFNNDFVAYMHKDPKPFEFKNLHYITEVEESKRLNESKEPCIIISASGMAEAGRIKHHIMNNLDNPHHTILLVGYCTPESLGGRLKAGNKSVRIFGEEHIVKARVESMESYSSHADYEEILAYLGRQDKKKIRQIFLVHGEPEVQQIFKQKFIDHGYTSNIQIPAIGDSFDI